MVRDRQMDRWTDGKSDIQSSVPHLKINKEFLFMNQFLFVFVYSFKYAEMWQD